MTLDALIPAAGRGSRLGHLTDDVPKCLLDLGGTTALELQVEVLIARGVGRLVVVTGYQRHRILDAVDGYVHGRAEIVERWNPFWSQTNVIGSVWMAGDALRGDFLYLHADTVFEPSIMDDLLSSPAQAALPVDVRDCEPEQMKAEVVDSRIMHLSKELDAERTAGEFIGIGLFRAASVPAIKRGMDEVMGRGELSAYFEAAINHAIREGLAVAAIPVAGRAWTEIDFPEDLDLARRLLPKFRQPSGQ